MNWQPDSRQLAILKGALVLACLFPLGFLLQLRQTGDFDPDQVESVQRWTGAWTFNLLLLTLSISPLRAMTQLHWLLRLRRTLGILAALYATLHLLGFIGLEHDFAKSGIARDILERPFIAIGFAAFILLVPLAATSNQWSIRRLGGRKWQDMHRNIYLIGILAAIHYLGLSRAAEMLWPIVYTAALAVLLTWRIRERRRKAVPVPGVPTTRPLRFFRQKPE